jgi:hypothetical protein|tara:strand:- start:1867 stop:2307 length:441 start_codon:yes stop_codon:yes gene_type:complete
MRQIVLRDSGALAELKDSGKLEDLVDFSLLDLDKRDTITPEALRQAYREKPSDSIWIPGSENRPDRREINEIQLLNLIPGRRMFYQGLMMLYGKTLLHFDFPQDTKNDPPYVLTYKGPMVGLYELSTPTQQTTSHSNTSLPHQETA